jgi:hypothetical protein
MQPQKDLFQEKWTMLAKNEEFMSELIALHTFHLPQGCLIWIKYDSDDQPLPTFCCVPKNDASTWSLFRESIPNFLVIEKGYNPQEHILMMLSILNRQQVVRVNINSPGDEFSFEMS